MWLILFTQRNLFKKSPVSSHLKIRTLVNKCKVPGCFVILTIFAKTTFDLKSYQNSTKPIFELKSIASSRTMLLEAILFDILRARSISWWVTWKKGHTAGIQMSFFDKRRKWQQNFSSDLLHQLLHHCRKIRRIEIKNGT